MLEPFASPQDLDDYKAGDPAAILKQVSSIIRGYCGWHVAPQRSETLILDGDGSSHLWMPSLHVVDVESVKVDGRTLDKSEYDWSISGFLELRCGRFSTRPRGIEVALSHGYLDVPDALTEAVVSIASRSGDTGGYTSEGVGQVRLTLGTFNGVSGGVALLAHEKEILAPYKLPRRA